MNHRLKILIAIFFAALVPFACQSTSKSKEPTNPAQSTLSVTSCLVVSTYSTSCHEYTQIPSGLTYVAQSECQNKKGSFTPGQPCTRANTIGGCLQGGEKALADSQNPRLVIWSYKDANGSTPESLKSMCGDRFYLTN